MIHSVYRHDSGTVLLDLPNDKLVAVAKERHFSFDLPRPEGTRPQVFGDKTYNHYVVEDVLEECGIHLLPKSLHPVTAKGFGLKVALFCLACSSNFL